MTFSINKDKFGSAHLKHHLVVDDRGSFKRIFCKDTLKEFSLDSEISQINFSKTVGKGIIRGMHFQKGRYAEDKIITCISGAIFDVRIDLRENSPFFGQWDGVHLDEHKNSSIYVPKGFAHGFQCLTQECKLIYFHTKPYQESAEGGLIYNCPTVNIHWPLAPLNISTKDLSLKCLKELTIQDLPIISYSEE